MRSTVLPCVSPRRDARGWLSPPTAPVGCGDGCALSLRALRIAAGVTQAELSRRSILTQQEVSRLESRTTLDAVLFGSLQAYAHGLGLLIAPYIVMMGRRQSLLLVPVVASGALEMRVAKLILRGEATTLAYARTARRWTQADVAVLSGRSRAEIARMERLESFAAVQVESLQRHVHGLGAQLGLLVLHSDRRPTT